MITYLKLIAFSSWAGLLLGFSKAYTIWGNLVVWIGFSSILIYSYRKEINGILQILHKRQKAEK